MVYILGYGGYQWGKSVKEYVKFYLVCIVEQKKVYYAAGVYI